MNSIAAFAAGIVVGIAILALTALAHPSHSYKEKIVCENYFGGEYTSAGCVVNKQIQDFKVR